MSQGRRLHARLYRITGGRFLPRWFDGAPVMVLETVGRRSGRKPATPVLYLPEAGSGEVVAERERLWLAFVGMYPQAEHYTGFTDRELPLIALEPADT